MNSLIIPVGVIYAGLAGTLLALMVATALNRWSLKVFFLLALRLAIGWHFLFEGLYKVNSHYGPPTETSRPFSSEPYFRVAPGPIGAQMRKQFDDPEETIAQKVRAPKEYTPAAFAKLAVSDQAAACPAVVAQQLDSMETTAQAVIKAEAEKQLANADPDEAKALAAVAAAEEKAVKEAKTDEEKNKAKATADADRKKVKEQYADVRESAKKKAESFEKAAQTMVTVAKATYARWVYGVDGRSTKVKFITGETFLTAPERLAHLDMLRQQLKEALDAESTGLGNGTGMNAKHVAEERMDLVTAEIDLAKDANAFVTELKKELNGGKAIEEVPHTSNGQRMDHFTMWFLVVVGGFLMMGLFTRLSCVMAAGFLVMTYLAHPPFPWYPLPPATEGNPVFINKNIIECLALLALACMPTGRWMGLDALVLRPVCRYRDDCCPPAPAPTSIPVAGRR
jgi:uncharacterized membrane protein YphA (DoxX/SURF4 family)